MEKCSDEYYAKRVLTQGYVNKFSSWSRDKAIKDWMDSGGITESEYLLLIDKSYKEKMQDSLYFRNHKACESQKEKSPKSFNLRYK